jgi:hypothetical protein
MEMTEIKTLSEFVGLRIADAAGDDETLSIVLDNGGILQIAAILDDAGNAVLHYAVEFAGE